MGKIFKPIRPFPSYAARMMTAKGKTDFITATIDNKSNTYQRDISQFGPVTPTAMLMHVYTLASLLSRAESAHPQGGQPTFGNSININANSYDDVPIKSGNTPKEHDRHFSFHPEEMKTSLYGFSDNSVALVFGDNDSYASLLNPSATRLTLERNVNPVRTEEFSYEDC